MKLFFINILIFILILSEQAIPAKNSEKNNSQIKFKKLQFISKMEILYSAILKKSNRHKKKKILVISPEQILISDIYLLKNFLLKNYCSGLILFFKLFSR